MTTLDHSDVSALLDALRAGDGVDFIRGGVVSSFHCRAVLHPTIVGVGHAQRVDQLKGIRSIAPRRSRRKPATSR